jgi:hypothetical protein
MPIDEPVNDKEWQARWDAQTLSEAEVIKADAARLDAATVAAGKLADDKGEEKKALDKVADRKTGQAPGSNPKGEFSPPKGGTVPNPTQYNVFQKV